MGKILTTTVLLWALLAMVVPSVAIIKGRKAAEGRFPYFVSLINKKGAHRCGGVLIAPDMVLTAASCSTKDFTSVSIGRGSVASPRRIAVNEAYIHPSYDAETKAYDMMLLKLKSRSSVQWVRVNARQSIPGESGNDADIEMIGIGRTSRTSGFAEDLQIKTLIALAESACSAVLTVGNSTGAYRDLSDDHKCFSDLQFRSGGQCFGDEGGPMVQVAVGGVASATNDTVVAVLSSLSGACASKSPSYPTRGTLTSLSMDFIKQVLCEASVAPPPYAKCT